MDAFLEKIVNGLNLDKSGWQLVKFGEIALQQKQKVDRENTSLTRYVKGEHMHSEDLHLREWGELKDEYLGPAFIRKFEENDILYGSRRTYLRKVVIAPFEGITSNTTFVIKANEEKIDKRLLPFIMLSEGFTQHSIRNSKGSVNPYVNWKDLAGYEFLLPPKELQEHLAKLIWSINDTIQKNIKMFDSLKVLLGSILNEKIVSIFSSTSENTSLKELITIKHGFPFKSEFWENDKAELPIAVTIGNYDYDGGFRFNSTKIKCYSGEYPDQYNLSSGDLLLAMTCQTPGGEILGIPGIIEDDGRQYLHNQRIGKVELLNKNHVDNEYLYLLFMTSKFRRFIFASASGTKVLHTSPSKILKYEFDLPTIKYQKRVIAETNAVNSSINALNDKLSAELNLQKSIINQVFTCHSPN